MIRPAILVALCVICGGAAAHEGMVWIPGGEFTMGCVEPIARPDERPLHRVRVDGFWMDETEVTNAQFRAFVEATGYVTTAEQKPRVEEIMAQLPPGTPPPPPELLKPGALVWRMPQSAERAAPVQLWEWTPGASWRHPEGPGSTIAGKDDYPVVQVSWDDAVAYAAWAGKRLPTEAEWEYASRGGKEGETYPWGAAAPKDLRPVANIWQGTFPYENLETDGFGLAAPVKQFPPNGYGLYDMAGNVWEWCADWYRADAYAARATAEVSVNPKGPEKSWDPDEPTVPKRVQRGGSFLCHESYCASYRNAARMKCSPDTGLIHSGFRCVRDR
jgi:sulfatase modifying factor 1